MHLGISDVPTAIDTAQVIVDPALGGIIVEMIMIWKYERCIFAYRGLQ